MEVHEFFLRLFAITLALAAPAHAAERTYAPLLGNYAGTCTVETASRATGAATLRISTPGKRPGRALLEIAGTVSPTDATPGTGNATPVKARLLLQGHRVSATNYLLGLAATRDRSGVARLRGSGDTYRFTLISAESAGKLRCMLRVRAGILTLTGTGFTGKDRTTRQPVVITIVAPRT